MRRRWIGLGGVGLAAVGVLTMTVPASSSALSPVHGLHATAVNGPGVELAWRWPASETVVRVKVRYALGSRAPRTSSSGDSAGFVRRGHRTLTVYGLIPDSTYSFTVFAQGHGLTSAAKSVTVRTLDAPTITSTSLPSGTVGKPYSASLEVADSSSGQWALESGDLPAGLSLGGASITGMPTAAATTSFVLRYTDAHGATTYAGESITIGEASPTPPPTPTPSPTSTPTPTPSVTPTPTPTATSTP
ncbi:MAG TPA: fibronectin type III domain-containing protein [Mycobacteriales bacterium]|nr:fibronectin type III domain-containing protein [Mycobacteriales bacterium]